MEKKIDYGAVTNSLCFVPGCISRFSEPNKKKGKSFEKGKSLSFFRTPTDPALREEWRKVIPTGTKKKTLTANHRVCELHFTEECINKYYETNLPDGSVHRIERFIYKLNPGAVPSIFPSDSTAGYKRIQVLPVDEKGAPDSPEATQSKSAVELITEPDLIPHDDSSSDDSMGMQANSEDFNFDLLVEGLADVKLPNKMWIVAKREQFVTFICQTVDLFSLKRVLVDRNLSTKIFFKEMMVKIPETSFVHSFQKLEDLLSTVDKLHCCPGIGDPTIGSCSGFVVEYSKRRPRCDPCEFKTEVLLQYNLPGDRAPPRKRSKK